LSSFVLRHHENTQILTNLSQFPKSPQDFIFTWLEIPPLTEEFNRNTVKEHMHSRGVSFEEVFG
jgi:hypothetical protein